MNGFPTRRLRRLRRSAALRDMLAGERLSRHDLIGPLFVRAGEGIHKEIPSMPGQFQHSVDTAVQTVHRWADLGLPAVLLFGIPDHKDATGSAAWDEQAPVQRLCRQIKQELPQMLVITDVCLCEYTDHGHCGQLNDAGQVDNDATLRLLARTAVSQARCGADLVAPSAMMDGQVAAIRQALDQADLSDVGILSYAVKFASSLYGPFRDAAESAPGFGDRKAYQMDWRSTRQAVMEAQADLDEGADILMVKPAGAYLDVLAEMRRRFDAPLAAYQVSGEYAMLKAAVAAGWLEEKPAVMETVGAIKRAGADMIITYFAEDLVQWMS